MPTLQADTIVINNLILDANNLTVSSGQILINGSGAAISSGVATIAYVSGVSGSLQAQINTSNAGLVFNTGNQNISGIKTFATLIKATGIQNQSNSVVFDLNQVLISSGFHTFVDFLGNNIYDASEITSISWGPGQRILWSDAGGASLDWSAKITLDTDGNPSIDWQNRKLLNSTIPTVNWATRNLISSAEINSVDWDNAILNDSDNNSSVDWINRENFDVNGVISIEWQNRALIDTGSANVLDWNRKILSGNWFNNTFSNNSGALINFYRLSGVSGVLQTAINNISGGGGGTISGNYVSLTGNQTISGSKTFSSGIITTGILNTGTNPQCINLSLGHFADSSNNVSVDWQNRKALDASARNSIDWTARNLINTSNVVLVDWNNQVIKDSNSNLSLDWLNRELADAGATQAVNWGSRVLSNSSSSTTLDWQNQQLVGAWTCGSLGTINISSLLITDSSSVTSVDWGNRALYDSSNIESVDWQNRNLIDSGGALSITYGGRLMYDSSAIAAIDWQNKVMLGNWTIGSTLTVSDGSSDSVQFNGNISNTPGNTVTPVVWMQVQAGPPGSPSTYYIPLYQ